MTIFDEFENTHFVLNLLVFYGRCADVPNGLVQLCSTQERLRAEIALSAHFCLSENSSMTPDYQQLGILHYVRLRGLRMK